MTRFQETITVLRAFERPIARKPSATSAQCPRLSAFPCWRSAAEIWTTRHADRRKLAAFSQYARSGPEAATTTPPTSVPAMIVNWSAVRSSEFARGSISSETRFGRPAYAAGRAKPEAIPAISASATICQALTANASRTNTASRVRSAPTSRRFRESRSTSGPSSRPIATPGRKSAMSSALTQTAEPVRSLMSITSATTAIHVPSPEIRVEPKSRRKLRDARSTSRWRARIGHKGDVSAPGCRRARGRARPRRRRSRPASPQ